MRAYEAPKMTFDKLELFERIASDKCWDSRIVKFDIKGDNYCPISIRLDGNLSNTKLPCNGGDPLFSARIWVADYFNVYKVQGIIDYKKWLNEHIFTNFPATDCSGFQVFQS